MFCFSSPIAPSKQYVTMKKASANNICLVLLPLIHFTEAKNSWSAEKELFSSIAKKSNV